MVLRRTISKKFMVMLLVILLIFNLAIPKTNAFIQIAIGGLAIGEALFYTAAALATGVVLYEAYDSFKNDSVTMKFLQQSASVAWNKLSAGAKEAWAELEETARATGAAVTLTAQQWMDAIRAGIPSWSSPQTAIPAHKFPGTDYEYSGSTAEYLGTIFAQDWINEFSLMSFTINGEQFALIPYYISRKGAMQNSIYPQIQYKWAYLTADGWTLKYTMPGGGYCL